MNALEKENYLAAFCTNLSNKIVINTLAQITQPRRPSIGPLNPEESFMTETITKPEPENFNQIPPISLQTLEQSFMPTIHDYGSDEDIVEEIEADQFSFEKPRAYTQFPTRKHLYPNMEKVRSESSFSSEDVSISQYLEEDEISATIGITSRTDITRYVSRIGI